VEFPRALRVTCLVLLLAAPAFAQEEPTTSSSGEPWRRELAGHVFIPSLAVTDPFVSTNVTLYLGAGYSWIDGFGFDVRGNPVGSDSYTATALADAASFQASLTRWLAVRLSGGGGINGGANGRSALVVGLVQAVPFGAGATASWKLGRMLRLGGTFDFVYSYSKLIQPLTAVRNSLLAGQVDTTGASQRVDGYTVTPGASVALAPHPAIGLLGSAQYMWNGLFGDVSSAKLNYIVLGASGQVDLRPITSWLTLGLLLGYRTQIPLQSNTRYTHTLEGGIFYTGRRAIDLGLDLQIKWLDLRADTRTPLDTRELITVLLLRYHWN
jgi:hypothetical protein